MYTFVFVGICKYRVPLKGYEVLCSKNPTLRDLCEGTFFSEPLPILVWEGWACVGLFLRGVNNDSGECLSSRRPQGGGYRGRGA